MLYMFHDESTQEDQESNHGLARSVNIDLDYNCTDSFILNESGSSWIVPGVCYSDYGNAGQSKHRSNNNTYHYIW